ncbi:hypothetical protein LN429_15970 [Pseudomonas syringae]|uniref:hypothetical protein n=1 Tax=Pseudomonas syringae TaxID=317 RepID=UPI00234CA2F6|nr:hypothetical protein [Pseudomonas syringae]MDC6536602.1 hypothetical protein [Pseudomonas syringae]
MIDLNALSPGARSAAMRGGTVGWGRVGGLPEHIRYMEPRPKRRGRQPKCSCGCGKPKTHIGMANGVCLTSGCEMKIRRWVKVGNDHR